MAPDDPEDDNPLQRWIDAEQRWGDPEGGFGNAPPGESDTNSPGDSAIEQSMASEADASTEAERTTVEVDSRTSRYFWSAVVLANVAVGAGSLGLMLIAFRGQWFLGGGLVLVGLLAGIRTHRIYREFKDGEQADESDSDA